MGLAKEGRVEFVTLREYLDKYGSQAKQTILLPMDAWNKSCTWGLGGDQVRMMQRKVEGLLLAAEVFDAAASALGAKSQAELLEKAWKDLMTSQSHDVGLCEYSRWQGEHFAAAERLEDNHNFTWGSIGYNYLDAAEKQGQQALDATLTDLSRRIGSATEPHGPLAVTVLNPHAWPRTDVVSHGARVPAAGGHQGPRRQGPCRQGRSLPDRPQQQGPERRRPHRRGRRLPGPAGAQRRLRHVLPGLHPRGSPAGGDRSEDRRGEAGT